MGTIILVLIIIGVLLWAFNTYVTTIDGRIKKFINVVVIIGTVWWFLHASGIIGYLNKNIQL